MTTHERTVAHLRELAKAQGWPRITLRAGCRVDAGEVPWGVFLRNPSVEDAALAVAALEARG
jgi:hypothetical protein